MRLLHTSDWHLGRSLHGSDLRDAQAVVLDAIVETVRASGIDVVLIAGDVFDRAVPPPHAIELWEDVLVRLRAAGAQVVVSSGNHDSAIRLGANGRLIEASGVHLRTRAAELAVPVVIDDEHGPVGIYAIPYLEPAAVRAALFAGTEGDGGASAGHAQVLARASELVGADAHGRGLSRVVGLAHAWVCGGDPTDSERDISVGGLAQVPAGVFADWAYGALGHLHGRQVIDDRLHYSGSPLAYSFSEARQRKGWWVVDLDRHGAVRVEGVDAPVPRSLSSVRGTLDELVTSRSFDAVADHFLAVTLTDAARPTEAMAKLQRRFPYALTLAFEPDGVAAAIGSYAAAVRGRTDLELASGFVEHTRGTAPTAPETALLTAAIDAVRLQSQEATESATDAAGSTAALADDTEQVA